MIESAPKEAAKPEKAGKSFSLKKECPSKVGNVKARINE
jgi:hypothetical protein